MKAIELVIKEKSQESIKKELQLLINKYNSEISKRITRYRSKKIKLIIDKIKLLYANPIQNNKIR